MVAVTMMKENEMELTTPVHFIKGIGEQRAKAFGKLRVFTAEDLLYFFPKSYEERGAVKKLIDTPDGENASVVIKIETPPKKAYGKTGIFYVKSAGTDGTDTLYMTFFNNKWVADSLVPGRLFRVYGKITAGIYGKETVNPAIEAYLPGLPGITPIYPLAPGLNHRLVSSFVRGALPLLEKLPEILPESVRLQFLLPGKAEAIRQMHFPESMGEVKDAVRRLAFEELLIFILALSKLREKRAVKKAPALTLTNTGIRLFFENLPFTLTDAQKRGVKEIFSDMQQGVPMTRLLQGDVGSGKTVLAAAAAYFAAKNGFQAAIMAPTEILAHQHFASISGFLSDFGITTVLLTGGMTPKAKKDVKEAIRSGGAAVIIGTNAVIQSGVEFCNLALAVTDEQHRFGVLQRASLITKGESGGEFSPHTLVMSATPIPRTLNLILYGDLDVSILNEMPPGRQKIETFAVESKDRKKVETFLRREMRKGRQVFVVCPLVEESETQDALSAEETYENAKASFPEFSVALLHGRMKAKDKTAVMTDFKNKKTHLLVSTTVIEVGVDVPNATVMVVENSERFGLSTLHQLRGRIGRGGEKSYCVLIYDKKTKKSKERIEIMCRTDDGFEIAEADLRLRGPGDFFGERQSGEIKFKVANIADLPLVEQTRALADVILDKDLLQNIEYADLNEAAQRLYINKMEQNTLN